MIRVRGRNNTWLEWEEEMKYWESKLYFFFSFFICMCSLLDQSMNTWRTGRLRLSFFILFLHSKVTEIECLSLSYASKSFWLLCDSWIEFKFFRLANQSFQTNVLKICTLVDCSASQRTLKVWHWSHNLAWEAILHYPWTPCFHLPRTAPMSHPSLSLVLPFNLPSMGLPWYSFCIVYGAFAQSAS